MSSAPASIYRFNNCLLAYRQGVTAWADRYQYVWRRTGHASHTQ